MHRIVRALQTEGLVTTPDGGGAVRLGPELGRLAAGTPAAIAWSIRPFLEALAQEVNETIDLATLYGTRVRFIGQVVPGRRLRATSIFGEQFPAHSTANGKALLAELPVPTVEATFPARLERFTANTITTRRELLAELERVRDAGVAFDQEETELGICAVAAVVSDGLGPRRRSRSRRRRTGSTRRRARSPRPCAPRRVTRRRPSCVDTPEGATCTRVRIAVTACLRSSPRRPGSSDPGPRPGRTMPGVTPASTP